MSKRMLDGLFHKCHKKKQVKTKVEAKLHARRMTRRYKITFKHYRCEFCGFYHVGRTSNINGRC